MDPRNQRSLALLRRVGLRLERHVQRSLCLRGEWVDDMVFAIQASEWEPVNSGAALERQRRRRE